MAGINIDPSMLNAKQRADILMQRGYSAADIANMTSEQLLSALYSSNPNFWSRTKSFFTGGRTAGAGAGAARAGAAGSAASSSGGLGASAANTGSSAFTGASKAAGMADDVAGAASKGRFFSPGFGAKIKSGASALANPQFNWTKQSGIQGWGKNLGGYATTANAILQGLDAAQGLKELGDTKESTEDLISDIIAGSANNPMVTYDLSADQLRLLNQLKRGTYGEDLGLDDVNIWGALGSGATGAFTGLLSGGIPGAVVGGIGGAVNSGIDDFNSAQARKNAELEALYAALQESNRNYMDMRKQRYLATF